jgi:dipeptidase
MRAHPAIAAPLCAVLVLSAVPAFPCTSILVARGATADGSTMITYAADSHALYGALYMTPAGVHPPGAMRDVIEWDTGKHLGRIPQAPVTYQTIGNMNEHQVAITESTWGGREELAGPAGIVDYGSLIWIALERSKTAREAIRTMASLVEEHGYASTGESFSISDPNEVWLMEMIGKGKGQKGAVWVARRVPEGHLTAHANHARIRTFPLADPENVLYSKDVVSFAREKGWFSGRDEEFSFADTYAPLDFGALRFCEARVWSVFRRAAPSLPLPADMIRGDVKAERLPLWIKPDRKLAVADVMALMRDHYQGTELDMTKDVGAGPFALPYRWRPMTWEVDGAKFVHERAISTQQTGYSLVSQSRSWLPSPIGGVLWFGLDDTASTVYMPMYVGMRRVPKSLAVGTGDFSRFSWDSAFWTFNFVSNWAYSRWADMIVDVRRVQGELEGRFLAEQAEVEKAALELHARAPGLARDHLTDYSTRVAEETVARWRKLGEFLVWKYLDGNVRDAQGKVTHPRYPDSWYRRIVEDHGETVRMPEPPKN